MDPDVIVLNGGSSSGKSSIARHLQDLLDTPWVHLGVDDLIDALSPPLVGDASPGLGREQPRRGAARTDRVAGMAAAQARAVHDGVRYDLVVDTSTTPTEGCARAALTHLRGR